MLARIVLAGSASLKRVAGTEDVAEAMAMLTSDDAWFVTGVVVRVDGGTTVPR
ncbi:SDR family oxidoreductase [Streptomyces sp. BE147]|uniref:SDR family oxidoreductase n=1 Tax=unclassified Streptomyces TaxID=2593676 RepID=UPI002E7904C4|nr:SDR family oxidoreductase [Streptomyces sp. BE147]MEE1735770.1 SDR family oxidoreductase [Streptomyces sp. BE147]